MFGMGFSFDTDKNEWEWMGNLKVEFWKEEETSKQPHKSSTEVIIFSSRLPGKSRSAEWNIIIWSFQNFIFWINIRQNIIYGKTQQFFCPLV